MNINFECVCASCTCHLELFAPHYENILWTPCPICDAMTIRPIVQQPDELHHEVTVDIKSLA